MSYHFTQICAFLTYSFRFMGYYSCFYRCKSTHFFKDTRDWACFFQMGRKYPQVKFLPELRNPSLLVLFYCFDIQLFNISRLSFNSIKLIQSQNH